MKKVVWYSRGLFSQPNIFKFMFSFLGQKIAFKNIYHTLEDFSKFDPPFKSTVICMYMKIAIAWNRLCNTSWLRLACFILCIHKHFSLNSTCYFFLSRACAIQLDDYVVITGGSETWKKVVKYNENGWVEDLPDLINARYYHSCSHYYDGDVLVSLLT